MATIAAFHLGSELRRFGHGRLPRVAIVIVMALPLLFGGLFVWSYYDPIGHLNKLPVALVNSDAGAERDGEPVNAGEEVAQGLIESGAVDFHLVSADEAREGVADGEYYFAVEIPKNFSAASISVGGEHPESARINVAFSNKNGFIPTMLGNSVTTVMIDTVDERLGTQVTNQLLVGYNTIAAGMGEAADGAGQLHQGATQASDGAVELADGTSQLHDGATRLDAGAGELADGAATLDENLGTARDGATTLAQGLDRLAAATEALGGGAGQVADGVDQIAGPLTELSARLRALGLPAATALADQLDAQGPGNYLGQLRALQDGARTIATQLTDPTAEYRAGIDTATAGAAELAQGLNLLKDGSAQLTVGARQLADATSQLVAGTEQLTVGAAALRDGLVELDAGSGELALRLSDAHDQAPTWEGDRLQAAADAASRPVKRELTAEEQTTFGRGLAPFFISLALFMGSFVMFMVLRPLQRRAVDSGVAPLRAVWASYWPALLIGLAQGLLVWLVQHFLIGVEAAHAGALLLAMWGASAAFVALSQAINVILGATAGRVVCIALMALQLVSSGGLYPVETQPAVIQWFHQFDPLTFSVNLFRQLIIGNITPGDGRAWQAVAVLVIIGAAGWTVSTLGAWRQRQIAAKDLHPEIAL